MYVETALRPDAQRRVREIREADIVVGIPTYKNARTIEMVARTAAEGVIQAFPELKPVLVVADGMSTDDTVRIANGMTLPRPAQKIVTLYQGLMGKGSALRAIFEIARGLKARACIVVDADLRSIAPPWIRQLAEPILEGAYDFVTPYYSRHRHEVAINDLLAYPLVRALYGVDLRQPLGGEVGLSGELVDFLVERDVWETDVARFGIHIWMTTLAINEGWRICQTTLGTKTHDFKDPTIGFEPKFLHVVGTLFRTLSIYRRQWPKIRGSKPVPLRGGLEPVEPEPIPAMREALREACLKGIRRFRQGWKAILTPEHLDAVARIVTRVEALEEIREEPFFPPDLWARVVFDFAVVYNKGEGDPDKVVMALLPLYYARKLSFIIETEGMNYQEVEGVVQAQADAFLPLKPYLLERWETYLPWESVPIIG
ncbi:MAG TPA: glycosyltransferase [Anaerolineae bacterium]|nr:glycosyltransferase [Anaerolineae bacterium]